MMKLPVITVLAFVGLTIVGCGGHHKHVAAQKPVFPTTIMADAPDFQKGDVVELPAATDGTKKAN